MAQTLTVRIRPVWEQVDAVREQSTAFLRTHGLGADVINAVGMVTSELVENATKYGTFGHPDACIEVTLDVRPSTVVVEVRNPINADEEANLKRLDAMVQWIRGYQDPFQAYIERLKEVSMQSMESHESGLGLVRIAYEGQSILDFYVNENNVLAVSAVYQR